MAGTERRNDGSGPRILLVALANDVGMDRIAGVMARRGATCAMLSPPGFYSAQSRFLARHFALPRHRGVWLGALACRRALEAVSRSWAPDLVVPLDDVAALLLRNLACAPVISTRLRTLIETSLGDPRGYEAACGRVALMQLAATHAVRIPRFLPAESVASALSAARAWGFPVVLKREHTCGGHGVTIAQDPDALRAAMSRTEGGLKRYRAKGRQWVWTRAGISNAASVPLLQQMIPGRPAMRTIATWHGQVLDGVSFIAMRVHPEPTGSSTQVSHTEHPEMADTARRMVAALGCSGLVSFDFILGDDGNAYLIEMNARPIGTTHLAPRFGHDAIGALLSGLAGEEPLAAACRTPPSTTVALFPKDLERDPACLERFLAPGLLHDVPMDDAPVMRAYLDRLEHIHPSHADALRRVAEGATYSPPAMAPLFPEGAAPSLQAESVLIG